MQSFRDPVNSVSATFYGSRDPAATIRKGERQATVGRGGLGGARSMSTHLPLVRAPVATPGKRSPWLGVHVPATTPSWKMTDVGEQPLSLPHPSPTSHRDSHAGLFPFRLPQLSTRRAAGLSFRDSKVGGKKKKDLKTPVLYPGQ